MTRWYLLVTDSFSKLNSLFSFEWEFISLEVLVFTVLLLEYHGFSKQHFFESYRHLKLFTRPTEAK